MSEGDAGTRAARDGEADRAERRRPAEAQARERPGDDRRSRPWRPLRHQREESEEAGRPEPISGMVGALLRRWGIAERVERAKVVGEWDEIVGPEIAEATGHVRIDGSTLFVEVRSASWMQELNMMRHQILRRLNAGRESGRVEKIVFLQGGRSDRRRGGGRTSRHGKGSG